MYTIDLAIGLDQLSTVCFQSILPLVWLSYLQFVFNRSCHWFGAAVAAVQRLLLRCKGCCCGANPATAAAAAVAAAGCAKAAVGCAKAAAGCAKVAVAVQRLLLDVQRLLLAVQRLLLAVQRLLLLLLCKGCYHRENTRPPKTTSKKCYAFRRKTIPI